MINADPARFSPRASFWLRLVLAAITVVGAAATALLVLVWVGLPKEPRIATDDRVMALTMARLDALDTELSGLAPISGGVFPTVGRSKCRSDSGDIFQPSTTRTWTVAPDRNWTAASEVADQLRSRGWTGPPDHDQFGSYQFGTDLNGWAARIVISPLDNDKVHLSGQVVEATPCRAAGR